MTTLLAALVFTACAGDRCRTVELPFDGGLLECQAHAVFVLAAWSREHPGWATRRYRCVVGRQA